MLNHLEVTNFKAWRKLDLRFGRKITGLFGENSSGKSSVIQFLLLLKQTKNATDRRRVLDFGGPNKLVDLGSYQDVVRQRRDEDSIDWTLDWDLKDQLEVVDPTKKQGRKIVLLKGSSLQESSLVGLKDGDLSARYVKYRFAGKDFVIEPTEDNSNQFQLKCYDPKPRDFQRNSRGRPSALHSPIKTHLFPDQAHTDYRNTGALSDFEAEYESLMNRIFYLGPLREYPQRQYIWSGASPDDVGSRGERTIDAIRAATESGDKRIPPEGKRPVAFQTVIANWLKKLNVVDSFEIKKIGSGTNLFQACVRVGPTGTETMLTDVGFGVSQVLPVLVLLYYVPEGSIVMMEQPEIHLHPSVQSGLADMMLQAAETRNIQIIVESHSEHLLRRFQRHVAEDRVPSEDLKLYFVGTNTSDGAAELNDLKLNKWGEIENWPDNFFGDEMEEIAAIVTASLRKRNGVSS